MAKLPHSMTKAARRSSCFSYSKFCNVPLVYDPWVFLTEPWAQPSQSDSWDHYHRRSSARRERSAQAKEELLRAAPEFGLEGLVAQRKNPVYETGATALGSSLLRLRSPEFRKDRRTRSAVARTPQTTVQAAQERSRFRWQSRHQLLRKSSGNTL